MGRNVDLTHMLGIDNEVTCPKCKAVTETYFDDYDIEAGHTNPEPGVWALHTCCRECDHEWTLEIRLKTEATIQEQVREFMETAKQIIHHKPTKPEDAYVRQRLRLVSEECLELLEACGLDVSAARALIRLGIEKHPITINMVEVADACGDIDYVTEGTRLAFGINGVPIAAEVQRTNMAKFGPGSWMREDGKVMKPKDWTPPDIAGELRKQGWEG